MILILTEEWHPVHIEICTELEPTVKQDEMLEEQMEGELQIWFLVP